VDAFAIYCSFATEIIRKSFSKTGEKRAGEARSIPIKKFALLFIAADCK